jgi:hypothetical protein
MLVSIYLEETSMRPTLLLLLTLMMTAAVARADAPPVWPIQRVSDCLLEAPNVYQCAPLLPPFAVPSSGLAMRAPEANTGPVQLRIGEGPRAPVKRLRCQADSRPLMCPLEDVPAGQLAPGRIQILVHVTRPEGAAWILCTTQGQGCPAKDPLR